LESCPSTLPMMSRVLDATIQNDFVGSAAKHFGKLLLTVK
jgi:hypothetical protein